MKNWPIDLHVLALELFFTLGFSCITIANPYTVLFTTIIILMPQGMIWTKIHDHFRSNHAFDYPYLLVNEITVFIFAGTYLLWNYIIHR